jgi:ArsR family transcriptional regulator
LPRHFKEQPGYPKVEKEFWTERAHLLRVMAHPVRLMILETLSESSRCVKDLNSLVPISQPHLSQHMAALRRANLVDCHSSANLRCYYLLQPTLVQRFIRLLTKEHPVRFRDQDRVVREARQRIGARRNKTNKVARRPKTAARRS